MQYREMVKKVQTYSGFSDQESELALRTFVSTLGGRLMPDEREQFASELPADLKAIALAAEDTGKIGVEEFVRRFCDENGIDEARAKKQIHASWSAIKDAISPGEIKDIKAQLPRDLEAMLH